MQVETDAKYRREVEHLLLKQGCVLIGEQNVQQQGKTKKRNALLQGRRKPI